MFSSLNKNIKYLQEVSILKAVLFLLVVPLTIYMVNTDHLSSGYLDTLLDYIVILVFALAVGNKDLLLRPIGIKKTLSISLKIILFSALLGFVGVKILGTNNPQGLNDVVYTTQKFLKLNSLLPLIGFGEEFLCVLIFLGVFSLLTGGRITKFLMTLIITAFMFGFLHGFSYPITAILVVALGHIPFIFATFFYRSIYPAVVAHIIWDGFNFFAHYNEKLYFSFFTAAYIITLVYIFLPKKKTAAPN